MALQSFDVFKAAGAVGLLCICLGCSAGNSSDQKAPATPKNQKQPTIALDRTLPRISLDGDGPCGPVSGPMPDAHTLGHWFANDRRARHTTFGGKPPDSSLVTRITNSAALARADAALDSLFNAWAAEDAKKIKGNKSATSESAGLKPTPIKRGPPSVMVYKAGEMYAVVPTDLESCGSHVRIPPTAFFFDADWRYLGNRS